MQGVILRAPSKEDEELFLQMTQSSRDLHAPWVSPPITREAYADYLERLTLTNQQGYLLLTPTGELAGVFNISEIVRGCFQSAYLGFYVAAQFAGIGLMSLGLQKLLTEVFVTLKLHRVEANIQPQNTRSIALVMRHGFRKEGYSERYLQINDQWCDHERFAITIEDWQNQGR